MVKNKIIQSVGLLAIIFMFSCSEQVSKTNESENNDVNAKPSPVNVQIIKPQTFALQTISNGLVEAKQLVELRFQTSGTLEKVNFANGEKVKKGDIIAKLESQQQQINLKKAEEAVKNAENELSSLLLGFGGKEGDTNSVNNSLLQNLKSQSGYTIALLNLKSAKLDLENTLLKAPFSGKIAEIKTQNFNFISGSDPFCTLISSDDFNVNFNIIEKELSKIHIGQQIKIIPTANDSILFNGKIIEINPVVDENGLIKIKAKVDNKRNNKFDLVSGMNVKVIIENIIHNQLVIPKSALILRSGRQVVFTYNNGQAIWNYVSTGSENKTSYIVTKGLEENDTVIISGALNLAHEASVVIQNKP